MDCGSLGSSAHGILQARILQWVAFPFSRGFPKPRDWTQVSCIAGRVFTNWAAREAHSKSKTGFEVRKSLSQIPFHYLISVYSTKHLNFLKPSLSTFGKRLRISNKKVVRCMKCNTPCLALSPEPVDVSGQYKAVTGGLSMGGRVPEASEVV